MTQQPLVIISVGQYPSIPAHLSSALTGTMTMDLTQARHIFMIGIILEVTAGAMTE